MSRRFVIFFSVVFALAGASWFWLAGSNEPVEPRAHRDRADATAISKGANSSSSTQSSPSPFSLESPSSLTGSSQIVIPVPAKAANQGSKEETNPESESARLFAQSVDVTSLGRSQISESEFIQLTDALRSDPELLRQLIDELRQESDAERRALIARLLGEVGGDTVTLTASELIYSGDETSRRLGLDLLQQIQPGNAGARDIASTLLSTEVEPSILVDTLSSLSRPNATDENSRELISGQVAFLTSHDDASVRGLSLSILSRWSKDGQYTEVLRLGLADQDPSVRRSAAYALVDHENVTQTLIDSLLAVAVNPAEYERPRRGAILALKGMPLDELVREQVMAAELELDIASRKN